MSVTYRAIAWNPQKRRYDAAIAGGAVLYLGVFVAATLVAHPFATIETILIRAFGTLAFLLLHVALSIGPLCRLDRRFLPLLYNRRHLGVTMFLCALVHGALSLVQFHAFGNVHPLVSVLTTSADWRPGGFPFQLLGTTALLILFAMAATSHDFWLRTLRPRVWKALHMSVYGAYALIVAHVALGALQAETDWRLTAIVAAGAAWIVGLHLAAGWREAKTDRPLRPVGAEPFLDVCGVNDIPDGRARVVGVSDERIAVFRYDGKLSAVSNVCEHQNGPLGEGRIIRGCIVCPWHGYEYRPESGASPPPFTEKVATFAVQVRNGRVLVDPRPHPPGTRLEPARIPS